MPKIITVAACQMQPKLGNVEFNLRQAEELIVEGFKRGAQWVIIPEFFTTGMGFHPAVTRGALPFDGPALKLLIKNAMRYNGYVGGSFIAIRGEDRYNTFVLAFPDGSYATHDKDIPTFWENCYYRGGSDDGIIKTEDATVGSVICGEIMRWQTAKRLKGKIDLVVSCSAWWRVQQKLWWLKRVFAKLDKKNERMIKEAPGKMARIVGVPIVHAALAGEFTCGDPLLPLSFQFFYGGHTQITNALGAVLAHLGPDDGKGVIIADIMIDRATPQEPLRNDFWIPRVPWGFKLGWLLYNAHGRRYYQKVKKKRFALG